MIDSLERSIDNGGCSKMDGEAPSTKRTVESDDDCSLPMFESLKIKAEDVGQPRDTGLGGGYIVLGRAGRDETSGTYTTRWRVDLDGLRRRVKDDALHAECAPCCHPAHRKSCPSFLWHCVRSDPFLLVLHLVAILVGVIKVTFHLEIEHERELPLIHSVIETAITILVVTIRVISGFQRFRDHRTTACQVEQIDLVAAQNAALRPWLGLYIVLGVTLSAGAAGCFTAFLLHAHLNWTILSNSFCLNVIMVASNFFMRRVNSDIARLQEAHQKAILFEALLLMHETVNADLDDELPDSSDLHAIHESVSAGPDTRQKSPTAAACDPHTTTRDTPDKVLDQEGSMKSLDPEVVIMGGHGKGVIAPSSALKTRDPDKYVTSQPQSEAHRKDSRDFHDTECSHSIADNLLRYDLRKDIRCRKLSSSVENSLGLPSGIRVPDSPTQDSRRNSRMHVSLDRTSRFLTAVLESPFFQQPSYIALRDQDMRRWEALTRLQLLRSMVVV